MEEKLYLKKRLKKVLLSMLKYALTGLKIQLVF